MRPTELQRQFPSTWETLEAGFTGPMVAELQSFLSSGITGDKETDEFLDAPRPGPPWNGWFAWRWLALLKGDSDTPTARCLLNHLEKCLHSLKDRFGPEVLLHWRDALRDEEQTLRTLYEIHCAAATARVARDVQFHVPTDPNHPKPSGRDYDIRCTFSGLQLAIEVKSWKDPFPFPSQEEKHWLEQVKQRVNSLVGRGGGRSVHVDLRRLPHRGQVDDFARSIAQCVKDARRVHATRKNGQVDEVNAYLNGDSVELQGHSIVESLEVDYAGAETVTLEPPARSRKIGLPPPNAGPNTQSLGGTLAAQPAAVLILRSLRDALRQLPRDAAGIIVLPVMPSIPPFQHSGIAAANALSGFYSQRDADIVSAVVFLAIYDDCAVGTSALPTPCQVHAHVWANPRAARPLCPKLLSELKTCLVANMA